MSRYDIRDLLGHFVKVPPRSRQDGMCPHACCRGRRPHPERFPVLLPKAMLRHMSEDELIAHYQRPSVGDSGRAVKQVLGELERREQAGKAAEQRRHHRATQADEYRAYLEHEFIAAERTARGNMLNRRGIRAGVDPRALWTSARDRDRYASDELRAYFDRHPPVSTAEFRGHAAQARGARRRRGARMYGVY